MGQSSSNPSVTVSSGTVTQSNVGVVSSGNSTTSTLGSGATFTGSWVSVAAYSSVVVSCITDQNGTLYIEFSPDGVNADSSLSVSVAAGTNEVHRVTVSKAYFRARFTNTSASSQTYIRLQSLLGAQTQLTSLLNSQVQRDADTIVVRPMDFNLMVSDGLYQNVTTTLKDGITASMPNGTVTEDIWSVGGAYTGFPASPAAAELVVAGADTGTVYYSYLAANTDAEYTFASKAIAGAATYALGHNIWRCNFMYFVSSSTTGFNAGLMTIRHTATPANIFCTIPVGVSQSQNSAYTVPSGSAIYLDRAQGNLKGGTSATAEGYFWYRANGESPRYRFPFGLQFGALYFDDIDYLTKIPALTDLVPRIVTTSTNNLVAQFTWRFVRVKA